MILAAEPEDLAWPILAYLIRQTKNQQGGQLSRFNFLNLLRDRGASDDIQSAVAEAWDWLASLGLIIERPNSSTPVWHQLTRRALKMIDRSDFLSFKQQRQTGYELLHPSIRDNVWPLYVRGDYDTAVGRAFKEVEVTMRAKGNFKTSDCGERLIKAFFRMFVVPGDEPDRSNDLPDGAKMFIGAFGMYRNPAVHQVEKIEDATFAMEVLVQAGHFLRIVEAAVPSAQT